MGGNGGRQEFTGSLSRDGATAVGQLLRFRLGSLQPALQVGDPHAAVCHVLIDRSLRLVHGLLGFIGPHQAGVGVLLPGHQGLNRSLGDLDLRLPGEDGFILPLLPPQVHQVSFRAADGFLQASLLLQELLVPLHLGGEFLELCPGSSKPLGGLLGGAQAVFHVEGIGVFQLQFFALLGLPVPFAVIFQALGLLLAGLPKYLLE